MDFLGSGEIWDRRSEGMEWNGKGRKGERGCGAVDLTG